MQPFTLSSSCVVFLSAVNEIACEIVTGGIDSPANFRRVTFPSNVLHSWQKWLRPEMIIDGDRSQVIVIYKGVSIYRIVNPVQRQNNAEVTANLRRVFTENACR